MATEHVDVLIIGAGLSGIDAGCHLKMLSPQRSFLLLEHRGRIGGTWDLFRYPGIRSDSDMLTMGYGFKPWTQAGTVSPGAAIRDYVAETAREHGIDAHIRFRHRVTRASWDSSAARWTVTAERRATDDDVHVEQVSFTAKFLFFCAGYYRCSAGYTPEFAGRDRFTGPVIHPQYWPEQLRTAGKRIIVIGSGATAASIVPSLAQTAAQVTMLQRSPSYYLSLPSRDALMPILRRVLPVGWAYRILRWRNILVQRFAYRLARRKPVQMRRRLIRGVAKLLPPGYDVATHFTPTYQPWDQRLCFVPDGDLFATIASGKAEVVTDRIATFTETGIQLASGRELAADIIVTATGLQFEVLGGAEILVDGRRIDFGATFTYKGVMFSGVPNLASVFGYTNSSWTLRADLVCAYVCRLLNHMEQRGADSATPRLDDEHMQPEPWLNYTSAYVQRAVGMLPKQGAKPPWRLPQDYFADIAALRRAPIADAALVLSRSAAMAVSPAPRASD